MLRDGQAYIEGLRDGRTVYVGGELVTDVTAHPAFAQAVRSVARLYDAVASCRGKLSYVEDGQEHNAIWLRPHTPEDLALRRRVHTEWAELTHGLIGRSPDHVAGYLTGMACNPQVADVHGQGYDKNILAYYEHVRDHDLYVSYAVAPPGRARAVDVFGKQTSPQGSPESRSTALRVIGETDAGVIVRGSKILATAAVLADELFIGNLLPMSPGEEPYAVTFAVPVATEGVRLIPRKSFEQHALSSADDPLAAKYDETDSVVFFDDVLIPWDRVFSYQHLDTGLALFTQTAAHVLGNAQAQSRLLAKMRLILGVVRRVSEVTGTLAIPAVREAFAARACEVAVLEGLITAADATPHTWSTGFISPNLQTLYATTAWSAETVPGFLHGLRELLGSQPFQLAADASVFEDDESSRIMLEAFGHESVEVAKDRYLLMKIAWDLLGSEFASRHLQYEMFYAGARHVTRARMNQHFDWKVVEGEVDRCLQEAIQ
jgi:4-hydroxyphenylacetate 3-monooxygenase